MSEFEKIQRNTDKTHIKNRIYYDMRQQECGAIAKSSLGMVEIVAMAFEFGMAKGYRAAKGEVRRA